MALSRCRNEEAIESYERALEIKPDDHSTWARRGDALRNLGRNEEAIESFERALEIKPDYHYAWDSRVHVLRKLGRYQELGLSSIIWLYYQPPAEKNWYLKLITWIYKQCGIFEQVGLLRIGHHQEAFENLQQALDISGNQAEFLYHQACFSAILGKSDRALDFLEQSIQLDPANKEYAKKDSDFDDLRNNPKFKTIVE